MFDIFTWLPAYDVIYYLYLGRILSGKRKCARSLAGLIECRELESVDYSTCLACCYRYRDLLSGLVCLGNYKYLNAAGSAVNRVIDMTGGAIVLIRCICMGWRRSLCRGICFLTTVQKQYRDGQQAKKQNYREFYTLPFAMNTFHR